MRVFKCLLLGIWAAIAVYTFFSFLAGPKGLSAYNYLLSERDRQWDNIKDLRIINQELERTRDNLIYDQDTLLVYARQMGYGHENERIIRIMGLSNIKPAHSETGTKYYAQKPEFILERYIKITAISIGLIIFAFLIMLEIIDRRSR